jgi:hypothetical protein
MDALRELWARAGLRPSRPAKSRCNELRRFRRFLDDQPDRRERRPNHCRNIAGRCRDVQGARACLPVDAAGHITYGARANAIKGRVPN